MKRFISLLLAFATLIGCFSTFAFAGDDSLLTEDSVVVVATDEEISPYASAYFSSYSVAVGQTTSGYATVCFAVVASGKMDVLGATSLALQKKIDGVWTTVQTWYYSSYPSMRTTDSMSYTKLYTSSYAASGTFRAVAIFYAKNSSGSESKSLTSLSRTL